MPSNLKKTTPEEQVSQNSTSAQVPVQSHPAQTDVIQGLKDASPFILLIVFAFVCKQVVDSLCRLVEAIKEK